MYKPLSHTLLNKVSTTRSKSRHFPYNFTSKPFPDHYLMHVLQHVAAHTVQKLRVISNKCPKTFDSFFSLYGIGTYIKALK